MERNSGGRHDFFNLDAAREHCCVIFAYFACGWGEEHKCDAHDHHHASHCGITSAISSHSMAATDFLVRHGFRPWDDLSWIVDRKRARAAIRPAISGRVAL